MLTAKDEYAKFLGYILVIDGKHYGKIYMTEKECIKHNWFALKVRPRIKILKPYKTKICSVFRTEN